MQQDMSAAIDELASVLAMLPVNSQTFATSLIDSFKTRGLSDKQAPWISKLIDRAKNPPMTTQVGSMSRIVLMLATAQEQFQKNGIKKQPAIMVKANEIELRLSIAGAKAKAPNTINVCSTEKRFDDRKFFGRIKLDGTYEPSSRFDNTTQTTIISALSAMASNPETTAKAFATATKRCCFCDLLLTDNRSKKVGYGPVCAKNYGLTWGK